VAFVENTATNPWRPLTIKLSRRQVCCKSSTVPVLHFEDQYLTSYAGLFLFQLLFGRLSGLAGLLSRIERASKNVNAL
jgi:hypothetical protein